MEIIINSCFITAKFQNTIYLWRVLLIRPFSMNSPNFRSLAVGQLFEHNRIQVEVHSTCKFHVAVHSICRFHVAVYTGADVVYYYRVQLNP